MKPEITDAEAIQAVASTISDFMDYHSSAATKSQGLTTVSSTQNPEKRLLQTIATTEEYITPLLKAMELEGSHHLATPCNLCSDDDDEGDSCDIDCSVGSAWAEKVQQDILSTSDEGLLNDDVSLEVQDEFRRSWYINPFADPPFYHPHVIKKAVGDSNNERFELGTVSEAVYEKPDFFFDGGFFSNTALEIRSKFNSIEAVASAMGGTVEEGEKPRNICSKMNAKTINWALNNAPAIVKQRYLERGIQLRAGQDIEHHSGPSWIWTHLNFSKKGSCDNNEGDDGSESEDEECCIIDSHSMQTSMDHPVPFAGGKLYCKLLSPARVLDWMYTDSLRYR